MDGARGLVDLDWSQWTPIFHPDDIDRDPCFNQYPYPDDDLDYDDEEEMETDYQNAPPGGASDARVATLASARHHWYRPPATYSMQTSQGQTLGSPRSTHTDTDTAMEMDGLTMAPGGPDTCHVPPRAKAPTATGSMSTPELAATVARGVTTAATQILQRYTRPPNETKRPPVDPVADAALRERLQRCLKASPWTTPGSQPVSERVSVFDQLGHRMQDTQKEDEWAPRPEMTPRKAERGRQPGRDQDSSSRPLSQKRRSQSCPREEASAKKGRTDSDNRPGKIQVGIDWANTGIGKPVPKPDSKHPSFKADPSGVDEPQPRIKSTVTKPKQPSETQEKDSGKKKEDAEKKVLQDKPHRWIEACVKHLDPGGYPDEVKSLRYFERNAFDFAMGIVAIADWGRRYLDKGLKYPIPTIPPYLFTPLPESCQSGAQVPVKPSQLGGPGGDQDSSSRPLSQKRRSQSLPREEASAKKGRTDSDNRLGKIQVGIDWANTGIGKPVPKPDSKHPSFKADPSGVDEPQPRIKSTVTKPKQPSETQEKDSGKKKEDAEKKVLQDKPHRWIEARVKHLDPGGYPDEVRSLRYFERNAFDFAMGIVAIADWGRRYLDKGLKYPIPTIPPYLFTPLPESCQSGAQVPVKPSQLGGPGGDVRHHCRESWKWLVTVLQFWMDEATVTDGAVYGGRVRSASALAQYMMDTVNPGLESGSKVSLEDVITRTPWMSKRLHGMTTGQEQTVRRQALPMLGESLELEVLSEKLYTEYSKKLPSAGRGKSPLGRAETLRLHLKKAEKGWTQASQSSTARVLGT